MKENGETEKREREREGEERMKEGQRVRGGEKKRQRTPRRTAEGKKKKL